MKKRVMALPLAALGLLAVSAWAADAVEIGFGIISSETPRDMKERWAPFLDDMAARTGLTIRPVFAKRYEGIIDAIRTNRVQVAHVGNKAAIEAVDQANGEVFAQVNMEGLPGYWSHLIVRDDSGITSVQDILNSPGKYRFGNGDRESTSGTLVPAYYFFRPNKINPAEHFIKMTRNSHGDNLEAILDGSLDVATVNSVVLNLFKAKAPAEAGRVRIIWTSPLIPSDPIVWRKDLAEPLKTIIRDFFLSYGQRDDSPERRTLIQMNGWSSFRASDNGQLIPIREIDLFVARTELEKDERIAPEDKAARLAAIDAELKALAPAAGISKSRHE